MIFTEDKKFQLHLSIYPYESSNRRIGFMKLSTKVLLLAINPNTTLHLNFMLHATAACEICKKIIKIKYISSCRNSVNNLKNKVN
jgi:hypothetical protein